MIGSWRRWFAWYPVKTQKHGWRWLCTVERAMYAPTYAPYALSPFWVYRPVEKKD